MCLGDCLLLLHLEVTRVMQFNQKLYFIDVLNDVISWAVQAEPDAVPAVALDRQGATDVQYRLSCEIKLRTIKGFKFVRVPVNYYDRSLEARQQLLGASSIEQLCKSIVLENVLHQPSPQGCTAACHSKYFLVLVQVCTCSSSCKIALQLNQ